MTTEPPTSFPAILARLRSLLKQRQVVEASGVDRIVLAELSAMERAWEEREKEFEESNDYINDAYQSLGGEVVKLSDQIRAAKDAERKAFRAGAWKCMVMGSVIGVDIPVETSEKEIEEQYQHWLETGSLGWKRPSFWKEAK